MLTGPRKAPGRKLIRIESLPWSMHNNGISSRVHAGLSRFYFKALEPIWRGNPELIPQCRLFSSKPLAGFATTYYVSRSTRLPSAFTEIIGWVLPWRTWLEVLHRVCPDQSLGIPNATFHKRYQSTCKNTVVFRAGSLVG